MSTMCFCRDISKNYETSTPKCFCKLWCFDNFTQEQFHLLKTIGKQRLISKGDPVFIEGSSASELFLIKSGRVKLSKCLEDGSEVILDFRKSGEIFGENVFIDEQIYPMSAWAVEDTATCGATKEDLEKIILQHPHIGLKMMENMSKKISALSTRLESSSISNLEQRLFETVKNIATQQGVKRSNGFQIPFNLTHEELSFLVNAHRVSVTKALTSLVNSGKIIRKGKLLTIADNSHD